MKLGNNFTCVLSPKGSGNYKDLDKTRMKLFPNFTRHHSITHTNPHYTLADSLYCSPFHGGTAREFDERLTHFLFSDYSINSPNLFS